VPNGRLDLGLDIGSEEMDLPELPPAKRVKGIEPSSVAWKATALPLSYTRVSAAQNCRACVFLPSAFSMASRLANPCRRH
jgi:hypothetical protein